MLCASFFIPLLILLLVYLSIGIYPGSDRSILASDAFSQFSNFHASFRNMLLGETKHFLHVECLTWLKLSIIDFLLFRWTFHTTRFIVPESNSCQMPCISSPY